MSNIAPGYQVHVGSYENDGDNTQINILSGLTLGEARLYVMLADSLSYSASNKNEYQLNGNDENDYKELWRLWFAVRKRFPEEAAKIVPDDFFPTQEEYGAWIDKGRKGWQCKEAKFHDAVSHCLTSLVGNAGEGYWSFEGFFRCADSIEVYYVPVEVKNVSDEFFDKKGELI